jgi:hypothetical protein
LQLYSTRDDIADDDSSSDHISEFLFVSDFSERLKLAHQANFASAAYMSSRESLLSPRLCREDLGEALEPLEFVKVASITFSNQDQESKLMLMLQSVLRTPAEDSFCFAFTGGGDVTGSELESISDGQDSFGISVGTDGDGDADDAVNVSLEDEHESQATEALFSCVPADHRQGGTGELPFFVRLLVNGEPVSLADLGCFQAEATLTVMMSIFSGYVSLLKFSSRTDSPALPTSYVRASAEIVALLSAYVAEVSLERLRHQYIELNETDFASAKSCLRKARGVVSSHSEVFFYVSRKKCMVSSLAPVGEESEIHNGFRLLIAECRYQEQFTSTFLDESEFVVTSSELNSTVLHYWCFVSMNLSRGNITIHAYHPLGSQHASSVVSNVQGMLANASHRVNQLLLLKQLHRSRTACELLIPRDDVADSEDIATSDVGSSPSFGPGIFMCPVVFATEFALFHRCATNPTQFAVDLERSVLQIFAVSNRRLLFVYRDEDGSIFYFRLVPYGGTVQPDGKLHLVVHGLSYPGPAITVQLKKKIQKKLLLLAVDVFSSVLTKVRSCILCL